MTSLEVTAKDELHKNSMPEKDLSTLQVSAEEEFRKNPELKKDDLMQLRSWMDARPYLPTISDEQLILFLHSCHYNMSRTEDCIQAYFDIRTSNPEVFSKRELHQPENQKMLSVMNYAEMPVKDPNGCHIIFHSIKDPEPSKYVFPHSLRIFLMMIDACLVYEGTSPGIVFLLDSRGIKFGHIMRLSLSLVRKAFAYLQEALPIRLRAIHVLNSAPIVDQVMSVMKPFMNKELFNMIHFHKGNNETVFKYLPKECIPQEFGGDLPSVAELHDKCIAKLIRLEGYFKEEEKLRCDKTRGTGKKTIGNDPPESAVRSLTID